MSVSVPPVKPPGRPRDAAKALAILDAGWALFLERGVSATPIEAIAARAGVSKVTLYTHFPDRSALFHAAMHREMDRIGAAQRAAGEDAAAPVAIRLEAFGHGLMAFLTSPAATDFYGAVASELRRHPELAQAFHELGPGRSRANLAAVIATAVTRGELVPACVAEDAAEQLFGLWQGFSNFQLLLAIDIDAVRAAVPLRVQRGVAAFLRLYGTATAG